jgi:hypothetical protein
MLSTSQLPSQLKQQWGQGLVCSGLGAEPKSASPGAPVSDLLSLDVTAACPADDLHGLLVHHVQHPGRSDLVDLAPALLDGARPDGCTLHAVAA